MLMRKFNVERTEDILTIRTVKSGWTGRRIVLPAIVWFTSVIFTLTLLGVNFFTHPPFFTHSLSPGLNLALQLENQGLIWIFCYQYYFGERVCMLDAKNDQVLINGRKIEAFSRVTSARLGGIFKPSAMGTGNMLHLETSTRRAFPFFSIVSTGLSNDEMKELASEVNAFLTERAAVSRGNRQAVWSWNEILTQ